MKKAASGILSALMVLYLLAQTGCVNVVKTENYNYKYAGGAFFWKAEYTVKGRSALTKNGDTLQYETKTNNVFTLTYTGDLKDLADVKTFEYSYSSSAGGCTCSEQLSAPLTQRVFTSQGETSGAVERPDEAIPVVVHLDDKVIKFDLVGNN